MNLVQSSASIQAYRPPETFAKRWTAYTSEVVLKIQKFIINCFKTLAHIFSSLFNHFRSSSIKKLSQSSPVGIANPNSNFCYANATLQTLINHPFIDDYLNEKTYKNCLARLKSAQESSSGTLNSSPNYYRSVYVFLYEWKQSYKNNSPRQNAEECLRFKSLIEKYSEYALNSDAYQDACGIYEILLNAMSFSLQKTIEKVYHYKLSDDNTFPPSELVISDTNSLNMLLLPLQSCNLQNIIQYEAAAKSYQKGDSGACNITLDDKVVEPSDWTESSAIISPPPSLFILQLERNIGTFQNKWIEFPDDLILNLSPLFSCKNAKYRVTGINIYEGAHYYSYIEREGQWYKCNDSVVTPVEKKEVEFGKAYFVVLAKADEKDSR